VATQDTHSRFAECLPQQRISLNASFTQEFPGLVELIEDPDAQYLSLCRKIETLLQVPQQILQEDGRTITFRDIYNREKCLLDMSKQ